MTERALPGLSSKDGAPVPLKDVEIAGEIVAPHVMLRVRQRYVNVERAPIEAIYTFPLPAEAAVVGFAFESGGRRVEGVVRAREEAFREYDEALLHGHGAALLDQERDDVFTCAVGNVNPGEEATIEIALVARTERAGEALRLRVPTLVAPRYIPGSPAGHREAHGRAAPTDRVPDADRITPNVVEDPGYRATLALAVHAGEGAEISSPSHEVTVIREGAVAHVSFAAAKVALDRDLVLVVEAGEHAPIEAVIAHREGEGEGFVALTHVPDLGEARATGPLSVVFVLDRSGSMDGASIVEARRALRLCLRHLREGDRFSILAFDEAVEAFEKEPVPLTAKTLANADRFLASIDARGGTELLAPLVQAMALANGGVVVLLTDGEVGNEDEIAAAVLRDPKGARVYSFGIGTNVSDALLRKLARGTGGAVESIHPGERVDEKVVAVFARAIARRVRDVRLACDGVELDELAPEPLPDLVDGEPWTLFARYARASSGHVGKVELRGTLDGERWVHALPIALPIEAHAPAVPKLWARERVRDLEAQALTGRRADAMRARIVALGVEHGLATKHTSFVAVETRTGDRRTRTAAEARPVPVHAPAGWAMFDMESVTVQRRMLRATGFPMPPAAPPSPSAPMAMAPPTAMARSRAHASKLVRSFAAADEVIPPSPWLDALVETQAPSAPAPMTPGAPRTPETPSEIAWSILQEQRASGLWDDEALAEDDASTRQALATIAALRQLLAAGVTRAHPIFGEPVRKAIDALVALAPHLAPSVRDRALLVAWLAAEGRRARKAVRAAIEAHAPSLVARLVDERALRAELGIE